MNWPNDADGDVFRRLEDDAFDFSKEYSIDFNVDFANWPPPERAVELLAKKYDHIEVFEPEEGYKGYLLFRIEGKLTYELVIQVQEETSLLMGPYEGVCDSWGVLSE